MIGASVVNGPVLEALREVQRPLVEARHAPGPVYASPEVYRLEVERLFRRDWLLVGREEELAEPGDYMTLRVADEPIIVGTTKNATRRLPSRRRRESASCADGPAAASVASSGSSAAATDIPNRLTGRV